ncbi:MAG: hypothetical protein E3J71_06500 [Candidatus Stahlbacteria bacterium]|nr:MAG: hypothetical protein E3J71_06500 [Candidatus Stahlbacteria bacterium]
MKNILPLILFASSLLALSYEEPEVVVELAKGSGNYEVGLAEEDVAIGPYRLVALDSTLYLLDQLNKRVLCYDTSGSFVREIKTAFRPFDMAVDRSGRIYLLENRTQPAQVAILKDGKEIERINIKYDAKHPITALVAHPGDSLLFLSGSDLLQPVPESAGILNYSPSRKSYRLKEVELESLQVLEASGLRPLGIVTRFEGRTTEILLCYGDGRLWVGTETYIQDKSGSFSMREVIVLDESAEDEVYLPIPSSYFSYDVGWRNVSVDSQGNIYVFTSTSEGKASILRWRPSP